MEWYFSNRKPLSATGQEAWLCRRHQLTRGSSVHIICIAFWMQVGARMLSMVGHGVWHGLHGCKLQCAQGREGAWYGISQAAGEWSGCGGHSLWLDCASWCHVKSRDCHVRMPLGSHVARRPAHARAQERNVRRQISISMPLVRRAHQVA